MDKPQTLKLWDMLDTLYPDTPAEKRPARNEKTVYAWTLALAPYTYEELKAAALEHVRKNRYYPAIAELISGIAVTTPAPDENDFVTVGSKQVETEARQRKWYEEHKARRHAAGLMTGVEAKAAGIPYGEHFRTLEGID